MPSRAGSIIVSWLIGIAGVGAAIVAGRVMHLNASTVGFAFLMAVLFASLRGGLVVGAVTSIAATLCYNYFFLPPLHTFAIREPSNWVALAAFLVTSVTVSRLVIAAKVQAERAEQRRSEVERLSLENAHVEALRESEMLKTSLLRAISHDLTTPLTAITLHTEALRRMAGRLGEDHEGEQWKAPIAGIAGETSRLHRRIDNLLSMARLEAGKAQPRPEPTPPADLFHAVRENLPLVFEARAVSIRVDDDCPDANVDPSLALEILVNLIENAHRVSPPESTIELVARLHPSDPRQVRIEVRDRGPGLPAGVADAEGNLLAGATSDIAQRGLGLEIARSLAAVNGGSVGITPREGGGTVARLDVPAAPLPIEEPL
jgi:two-component system sensor histidine kinase KdpD